MTLRDLGLTEDWFTWIEQQEQPIEAICTMAFRLRLVIFPLEPGRWLVYTSKDWAKVEAGHDSPLAAIRMVCRKLLDELGEDGEVPQDDR